MKEIIIGTNNPAKVRMVQSVLLPLGIKVKGTSDVGIRLDIDEDGETAQENARKKSLTYARALGRTVLSIDNALYLNGLSDNEQPGINIRSISGREGRATDEELLQFYSQRIAQLGGRIDGYWEFAVCITNGRGQIFEKTVISPREFVSEPSQNMLPGYPLESIQIEPKSGKYIADMTQEEQMAFWQEIVGRELCSFVQEVLTGLD